jgi:patatin-like phospholipase/acyl hydrolase
MRVLCIDGGGIRGLIPALVLAEIEKRTGRRTAELFDLIAGTSTGGILACALAKPGPLPAAELAGLYVDEGPEIFRRSLLKRIFSVDGFVDERYEDDGLNEALRKYLGQTRLSQSRPDVFITAYDIKDRFAFFFRSSRARRDATYDFSLVDAARATSAAPTYFEPVEVTDVAGARTYPLIDGGVYAVNPAMCAYAETRGEFDVMLSLGTGEHTRAYSYHEARWWGQAGWARPVIDMVFDGVADTIEFQLKMLAPERYFRLQTVLTAADDMDDASEENLTALRADAERLIRDHAGDLDAVIEKLAT